MRATGVMSAEFMGAKGRWFKRLIILTGLCSTVLDKAKMHNECGQ